ncbi:glycosyltransferase [Flavobacterium sp. IMCC34852]|uniref:Glycosyltransferase n=1 Tax=Flavobacterium rivulicola TaxID=2732161 RepID=A0A7Y3R6B9_9FLAO|nr:glycosyltransferase [Flavobacterium sp. IMCC34852]NNT70730.1 glycosyltransferase [Flavobacterium sp. IMCC34852]
MTIALSLILLVYVALMVQLILGYDKVKTFKRTAVEPKTAFSIIVPFRNEEKNLPRLLQSFSKLNYPYKLIEIVMVDDFSTDLSERVCIKWRLDHEFLDTTLLENLRLSNSPKKDAIGRAVPIIKHDWIITTDADCTVPENWLLTLDNYIQKHQPEMIVGAVKYKTKNNWFHKFQQLDLLSLQGTTIGSFGIRKPFMCNGANFAYTKKLFKEIGGFEGVSKNASGDDVFLLQKATKNHLDKIHYLKNTESIVKTKPENDLFDFFMQRVRWASKTSGYQSSYAKFLAVIVLLMNLGLVICCLLSVVGNFDWSILLGVFSAKYLVDYWLLHKTNKYLLKGQWILPLTTSIIYPFYSSLVGVYSLFGNFSWKGRQFSK